MSTLIRFAQFIWSLTPTPVLYSAIPGRKWTLWNGRLAYLVRDSVVVKLCMRQQASRSMVYRVGFLTAQHGHHSAGMSLARL